MGKWRNAPVIYVIVQVRFSPILSLHTYLAEIQEHFRKSGFPSFSNRFNFQLGLSGASSPDLDPNIPPSPYPVERTRSYLFSSRDGSQSFVLEQNGLTFHVSDYEDFDWFLNKFLEHLERINSVIGPDSSERIGLRYIDAVTPREGTGLRKYLVPEVLGLSQSSMEGMLQHSFSETVITSRGGSTVCRVLVREGQIAFPPDVAAFPIPISPRFTDFRGLHATIDTDAFSVSSSSMNLMGVRTTLEELHERVGQTFRAVVTESALSDWK